MKKSLFSIALSAIFFLALTLVSCNQQKLIDVQDLDPKNERHAKYLRLIEDQEVEGVPFPEGSSLIDLGNGKGRIVLPTGYHFLVKNRVSSLVSTLDAGEITCECTKGTTGCAPMRYGGKVYCGMGDGCSSCNKTVTDLVENIIDIVGIYKDGEPTIRFMVTALDSDPNEANLQTVNQSYYPSMNSSIFGLQMVQNHVRELYDVIYNNNVPNFIFNGQPMPATGYKFVQVDIFGNSGLVIVPESFVSQRMISYLESEAGTACKCKKGTGCELHNLFWGAVYYCSAGNCTKCAMTF